MIPDNWDKIEAQDFNNFESLTLGGHICNINEVSIYTNPKNGNMSLKILVDICENSRFDGYFQKIYNNMVDNKRWPNEATKYLSLKYENLGYVKSFTNAVNASNDEKLNLSPGEIDTEQFKNKKVACQFGLIEYKTNDGEIKTSTNIISFKPINEINDITIPNVKLIDGTYVNYDEYKRRKQDGSIINENNHTQISMNLEDNEFKPTMYEEGTSSDFDEFKYDYTF